MNCKPGDLAYIVRPWTRDQDIGRPVTVLRRAVAGQVVEMRGGGIAKAEGPGDHAAWLCEASGAGFPCFIADVCLRPFRDQDGEDETLTWAGKPSDIKTPEAA